MIKNIVDLDPGFFYSDDFYAIFNEYDSLTHVKKSDLHLYGIYEDNTDGLYYKNHTIMNNGKLGQIRVQVGFLSVPGEDEYVKVDPLGIKFIMADPLAQLSDLMLDTLGSKLDEDWKNENTQESINNFLTDLLADLGYKSGYDFSVKGFQFLIDKDGHWSLYYHRENGETFDIGLHIFNCLYDLIYERYSPIDISFDAKPITYDDGEQIVLKFNHNKLGEISSYQLYDQNFTIKSSSTLNTPNKLNDFIKTNLLNSDEVKNILETHPFVRIGFGETGGDEHFSFMNFYFYDVVDNKIVVSTVDDHQEYAIQYTSYYEKTINNLDEVTPTVNPAEFHNTSGSTVMMNIFHYWSHTHSIGCIDLIGWTGDAKPIVNKDSVYYPRTGNFVNDIPNVQPDPDDTIQETPDDDPKPRPPKIKKERPTPIKPKPDPDPIYEDDEPEPDPIDDIDPVPPVPADKSLATGFVYKLEDDEVDSLRAKLWNNDILGDLSEIWKNDPMQGIISLNDFFVDVTADTENEREVVLGNVPMDIVTPIVTDRYQTFPYFNVAVPRYFNDVRDFDTKINIYVPFCGGFHELDTQMVMGGILYLTYNVDVLTGDCVAILDVAIQGEVNKDGNQAHKLVAIYNGNVSVPQIISHNDKTALYNNLANIGKGVVGGVINGVPGGVGGALIGGLTGGASGVVNMMTSHNYNIERTGQIGSNLGAMSPRIPFLEIIRPIPYDANKREVFGGKPTNATVRLSNVKGFTVLRDIHVDDLVCTDFEKDEIENALKSGVQL